jgi:alkylated DNA repair protein (DNA oxidative demethylase)
MNKQAAQPSLFGESTDLRTIDLGRGAFLLRGFALNRACDLLTTAADVARRSPFRQMTTPGGFTMSVAMTGCGEAVWVSDRKGYRYAKIDPLSDNPWLPMPTLFDKLAKDAAAAAGYPGFHADSCLINRYAVGTRLTLHQDKNERDYEQPIVSVSLGLPAKFIFGGLQRSDKALRLILEHGDVAVWGGASRLAFHGVDTLKDGTHPEMGDTRINLTFRRAL